MEKLINETTEKVLNYAKENPNKIKSFIIKTDVIIDEFGEGYNHKPYIEIEFYDLYK